MQNNKHRLMELCNEYDVHIQFEKEGCLVYYKNSGDTDIIPFTDEVDTSYILENFEMVADLSKLQLNVHELQY